MDRSQVVGGRGGGLCILGNVTEVADLRLQTPVPLVFGKEGVLVEEAVCHVSRGRPSELGADESELTQSRICTWRGNFQGRRT